MVFAKFMHIMHNMNWAREGTAAQALLEAWKQNNKAPSIGSYYATT